MTRVLQSTSIVCVLSCFPLQAMLQQLMQSGGLQQLMGGAGARMG
jgi:hypothetical protein